MVGAPAPMQSSSANTAATLSPLLKQTYADYLHKVHKMAYGGWAPEETAKLPLPSMPGVHAPASTKVPLAAPIPPRTSIPKRLKKVSDVKGFDEGGDVPTTPDNPEEIDLNALPQTEQMATQGTSGTPLTEEMTNLKDEPVERRDEEAEAEKASDESAPAEIDKAASDSDDTTEDREPASDKDERTLPADTITTDEALKQAEDDAAADTRPDSDKELDELASKEAQDTVKASDAGENTSPQVQAQQQDTFNPINAMQKAVDWRNKMQLFNQLGAITERAAAAYGHFKPIEQDAYKENMLVADQAIQDVKNRIALQGEDPNSGVSKMFRQYLQKFSGQPVDPNTTASDIKDVMPMAFKDAENKLAHETALERTKELMEAKKSMKKHFVKMLNNIMIQCWN
jgi:hypothetical protein